MKSFSYVAQDAKNNQVKGTINAENEQEFLKKIKEKGLYVKDYKESDSTESNLCTSLIPRSLHSAADSSALCLLPVLLL